MDTRKLAPVLILLTDPSGASRTESIRDGGNLYVIGAIIALFILAYLIYSLLKPDKF